MAKHEKKRPRSWFGGERLFFTALAAVTVFAWLLPLRPTVSEKEKRNLEAFPTFSSTALADGSYFEDIGLWFSDTFPARDRWIRFSQRLERLYGRSDVVIYGSMDAGDAIPVATETLPAPSPSPVTVSGETAVPTSDPVSAQQTAQTPEPTALPEPEEPEDGPVGSEELISFGAVIQVGDAAYAFPTFGQRQADRYAANISRAAALLDGKCRVFDILVLHSTSVILSRDFRQSMGCALEEDVLDYIHGQMDSRVLAVDTFTPLQRHNNEYIYFRSDHHWTALGAWYAYEEWAKRAGFTPVGLEEYTEGVQEPFRGTLYYKADQTDKIREDAVHTYTPPGDVHLFLQFNKDKWEDLGTEQALITEIRGIDKYAAFLSGDVPMATFVNNDITDGSACLLIKNSNGNPLSYYFTQHYQYTFVLDYRKYFTRSLTKFVDYYDVDDVIFCLNSAQAESNDGNDLLEQFIK